MSKTGNEPSDRPGNDQLVEDGNKTVSAGITLSHPFSLLFHQAGCNCPLRSATVGDV